MVVSLQRTTASTQRTNSCVAAPLLCVGVWCTRPFANDRSTFCQNGQRLSDYLSGRRKAATSVEENPASLISDLGQDMGQTLSLRIGKGYEAFASTTRRRNADMSATVPNFETKRRK